MLLFLIAQDTSRSVSREARGYSRSRSRSRSKSRSESRSRSWSRYRSPIDPQYEKIKDTDKTDQVQEPVLNEEVKLTIENRMNKNNMVQNYILIL